MGDGTRGLDWLCFIHDLGLWNGWDGIAGRALQVWFGPLVAAAAMWLWVNPAPGHHLQHHLPETSSRDGLVQIQWDRRRPTPWWMSRCAHACWQGPPQTHCRCHAACGSELFMAHGRISRHGENRKSRRMRLRLPLFLLIWIVSPSPASFATDETMARAVVLQLSR